MPLLRVILLISLVVSVSPLPYCALQLEVIGENCHGTGAEDAQQTHDQQPDVRLESQPDHDADCGCDVARTSRVQADDLWVPALLPVPELLVPAQPVAVGFAPPVSVAPPPVQAAVSLPLLI